MRGYERGFRDGYESGSKSRFGQNLYPMGAVTFAIACIHCKNIRSGKCYDCKCEKVSGFELKEKEAGDDTV